jgi:hypothetical protein
MLTSCISLQKGSQDEYESLSFQTLVFMISDAQQLSLRHLRRIPQYVFAGAVFLPSWTGYTARSSDPELRFTHFLNCEPRISSALICPIFASIFGHATPAWPEKQHKIGLMKRQWPSASFVLEAILECECQEGFPGRPIDCDLLARVRSSKHRRPQADGHVPKHVRNRRQYCSVAA